MPQSHDDDSDDGESESGGEKRRDGDDYSDDDVVCTSSYRMSARQQADKAMEEWESLKYQGGIEEHFKEKKVRELTPEMIMEIIPIEKTLEYWKNHGMKYYPLLAEVAVSVMAVEAAAADIERDFCVSGMILTGQRSTTCPLDVDMLMFCRRFFGGQEVIIPDDLEPHLEVMSNADEKVFRETMKRVPNPENGDDLDSDVELDDEDAIGRISGLMDSGGEVRDASNGSNGIVRVIDGGMKRSSEGSENHHGGSNKKGRND